MKKNEQNTKPLPERNVSEYRFIANIEKIASEKLKSQELVPDLPISKFIKEKKRFYSTSCTNPKGEKVLFKMIIVENKKVITTFKREVEANILIEKKKNINVPSVIKAQLGKKPYWFTREYVPGKTLGDFYSIRDEFKTKEIAEKLADNLHNLQNLPKEEFLKITNIKKDLFRTYEVNRKKENLLMKKDKKDIDLKKIDTFYKKMLKKDSDQIKLVPCHGDYTSHNLVVSNKKIYMIDLERMRLSNFCADLTYLWMSSWKFPTWRKDFLESYIAKLEDEDKELFKETFRLEAIANAIGVLISGIYICSESDAESFRKSAKLTIESALKSFNSLLKI